MDETLPEKAEERPLAKALAELPATANFRPTPAMIDFVEARIRNPRMKKLRSVAKKAGIEMSVVDSWFQDDQFITWFDACQERSDQFWAAEVRHELRRRALKGDRKLLPYFLNHVDRRIVKQRQAAAQATNVIATHVTVTLGEPKDPEVRAREVEIQELKVIKS